MASRVERLTSSYEDSVVKEYERRWLEHFLKLEKRLWQPINENKEMKTIKVLPVRTNEEVVFANNANRSQCYFYNKEEKIVGICLTATCSLTTCSFNYYVKWSNGNTSAEYSSFSLLVESISKNQDIQIMQIV